MKNVKTNAFYADDDGRFLWREKNIFTRLYGVNDSFMRHDRTFFVKEVMIIDSEQVVRISWSNLS